MIVRLLVEPLEETRQNTSGMKHGKVDMNELVIGSGELAEGDVWIKVRTRMFLNRGDAVPGLWDAGDDVLCFRLKDREVIAGLRYAVEGMRVGGRREVIISPHLAYGESGIPGLIPPHALLRGELELVAVGQPGEPMPMPRMTRPGRILSIHAWGEESSRLPRWHLSFHDRHDPHYPSQCCLGLEWSTRDDGKWGARTAQKRNIKLPLDPTEIERLIETAKHLPAVHPAYCLGIDEVHSHGGYSPPRANTDSVICRSVSLFNCENKEYQTVCYLRENSPFWTETEWGKTIMAWVQPHLTEAPWRQKAKER